MKSDEGIENVNVLHDLFVPQNKTLLVKVEIGPERIIKRRLKNFLLNFWTFVCCNNSSNLGDEKFLLKSNTLIQVRTEERQEERNLT